MSEVASRYPHQREPDALRGLRTRAVLRQLGAHPERWMQHTPQERLAIGLGLRDAYFETREEAPEASLQALVREVADVIPALEGVEVDRLRVSFYPAGAHRALRFVAASALPAAWRSFFARPLAALPEQAAVFVDPGELSFRTFEHITPLDRLLTVRRRALWLKEVRAFGEGGFTASLRGSVAGLHMLRQLDALGLYVAPLNTASRGGARFIFHAAKLASALTHAVRKALPEELLDGFVHVNPVFRCNRFTPDDRPFPAHLDAPYRDRCRGHLSLYTMIIYLTGGRGDGVLRVGDHTLDALDAMTCVVFPQHLEHEGRPFDEGDKVFLRTELIFDEAAVPRVLRRALEEAPEVGALFTRATYLTGECVFAPELAPFTESLYNRVADAHWRGMIAPPTQEDEPFLHKAYRGQHFVTNGHDYWFRSEELSVQECAALAILDHFNCTIDGVAFHRSCVSEVVRGERDARWVPAFLRGHTRASEAERPLGQLNKAFLFPDAEEVDLDEELPSHISEYERLEHYCTTARTPAVVEVFRERQDSARALVEPAPIYMMGQEIFLDPSRFVIEGDRVHVMTHEPTRPLHFAAMSWVDVTPEYPLGVAASVQTPHLLLPPILFDEGGGCTHLALDFFRNTWLLREEDADFSVVAEVPYIDR